MSLVNHTAKQSLWALGVGLVLAAALPGCVAHARGEIVADYPAEYVEIVPPRIEYYPRTYYRGSPAYLVEGRWYYRTRDRWVIFREEPVELRNYRVRAAPAYVAPTNRYYGRNQERLIGERRADERRALAHRDRERREAQQRAEQQRREERREARRAEERREAQRAEEHRRLEEQRDSRRRAEEDRRVAERRGRPTRKRDRSHGDQKDSKDERDRRRMRQD